MRREACRNRPLSLKMLAPWYALRNQQERWCHRDRDRDLGIRPRVNVSQAQDEP
jgi:hypothetical protein